jgi:hypothetical protein
MMINGRSLGQHINYRLVLTICYTHLIYKEGKIRFLLLCIKYRACNSMTLKDKYLLSYLDNLLHRIHGHKHFKTLDLKVAYY